MCRGDSTLSVVVDESLATRRSIVVEAQKLDLEDGVTEASQPATQNAIRAHVLTLVIGHSLCASFLLVVNKWAMKEFPFVWTLTTFQFAFAAGATYVLGQLGMVELDALNIDKLVRFFPAAGMFFITITAGNAVVGVSNVDTFIVMRSVVPIPSALLEAIILKEPYPPPRSWAGLVTILIGAIGYCMFNKGVVIGSAAWVVLYLVLMPLDGVLIKQLVGESGLSPWGLVLYNNVCALGPGVVFSVLLEWSNPADRAVMADIILNRPIVAGMPVLLSCWCALAISYFQLNVRKVISSTAFMVLGVSNKIISVLLSQLTQLDANGDLFSIGSVLVSIVGAIVFQQTVKGNGISQAPQLDKQRSVRPGVNVGVTRTLVAIGVFAAAVISHMQKRG
jgi:GDP-mannose transporter